MNRKKATLLTLLILLLGCSKRSPPLHELKQLPSSTIEPILADWDCGQEEKAVNEFLCFNWDKEAVFAPASALSLSERELDSLSQAAAAAKMRQAVAELQSLRELVYAVDKTGRDAENRGEVSKARACFISMEQCGGALQSSNRLYLVQLVGKSIGKTAGNELLKANKM